MPRFIVTAALAMVPALAAAEPRFITEEPRIPLHESPCITCATVHPGLVPGTYLTVEESEGSEESEESAEGWTRVTTEEGTSGWLPSLFLTAERSSTQGLNGEQLELREDNIRLRNQLADVLNTNEELQVELSTVRKLSTHALGLQEQNEELIKRNRMLQSEIDVLTASRDQLASDSRQRWFLYGGLTLFLGAVLAVLLPSLKPRRRYSEWG